jgi:hypothetical protein
MDEDYERRAEVIEKLRTGRVDVLIGSVPFELNDLVMQMVNEDRSLDKILAVIKEKKAELREEYKARGEEPWGW